MKILLNSVKNEKQIIKINHAIKNNKMRRYLWSDKYNAANRKWREYCKSNNINYINGGWKPEIKKCSTKSQWQWKMENEMAKNGKNPLEIADQQKINIKYGRKAIILYDKKYKVAQVYDAELERYGDFYTVKIIVDRNKIIVNGVKNILEEDFTQEVIINGGKITVEDLVKISLETSTEIITITRVKEK